MDDGSPNKQVLSLNPGKCLEFLLTVALYTVVSTPLQTATNSPFFDIVT